MGASAIHVRCMDELTKDAVREIEQIHSSWMEFEVAGQGHSLMALCADDIELWPPDARPLLGRTAVLTQMAHGTTRIHRIEITDRRIRGSNEIAYLTASYKTTFSPAEDSTPRQALGSHLWILQKRAGTWVVTLVSWSLWPGDVCGICAVDVVHAGAVADQDRALAILRRVDAAEAQVVDGHRGVHQPGRFGFLYGREKSVDADDTGIEIDDAAAIVLGEIFR